MGRKGLGISSPCNANPSKFMLIIWFSLFQVGTQIDLRDDAATIDKLAKNKQKPLSLEAGEKLAKELRAVKYVECSALTQVSV